MDFHVKDAAATAVLEEIAAAFRDQFPLYYERCLETLRTNERFLKKPSAMSDEGTLLLMGQLPPILYSFIKHQMRKRCGISDFFADPKHWTLLFKVWPDARIRRTPTRLAP